MLALNQAQRFLSIVRVQDGGNQARHIVSVVVGMQDAGKKQVAAILGVQSARAATQPRPFLRLARQHLAVQARSLFRDMYPGSRIKRGLDGYSIQWFSLP